MFKFIVGKLIFLNFVDKMNIIIKVIVRRDLVSKLVWFKNFVNFLLKEVFKIICFIKEIFI